jgi:hypothetical protein
MTGLDPIEYEVTVVSLDVSAMLLSEMASLVSEIADSSALLGHTIGL